MGSGPAVNHISHSWCREGQVARIAAVCQKSATLMWAHPILCTVRVHGFKRPQNICSYSCTHSLVTVDQYLGLVGRELVYHAETGRISGVG